MVWLSRLEFYIFIGFIGGGVISWLIGVRYFLIVLAEYQRALSQGCNLPKGNVGLPPAMILTDLLPAVSNERRKLIWAIKSFVGFWLAGAAMFAILALHQ